MLKNLSGRLGDLVFRKCRDKTVVAVAPSSDKNRIISPRERAVRDNFKRCSLYARNATADPEIRAQYEAARRKRQSAYHVAFLDAFHGPRIESISAKNYSGAPGDPITVCAVDNFKVAAVHVSIFDRRYKLIEEGDAEKGMPGAVWKYAAKENNPAIAGSIIVAMAVDMASNDDVSKIEI